MCQNILSSFMCTLNADVEDFIRTKAIQFAKQRIAISYLVFAENEGEHLFVGYYTLANKFVCVNLGKNFNSTLPFHIEGADLLEMALERVIEIEHLIGGKTVYIECNNQPKLFDFYSGFGFFPFNKRIRQNADLNDIDDVLVQMLKYFNSFW